MFHSMNRRSLFSWAAAAGAAVAARALPTASSPSGLARWPGAVLQVDEGDLLISGRRRAPIRIKIDSSVAHGATMSMIISEVAPGAAIPVHLHQNEDELIFIHEGQGTVTLDDRQFPATPGAVLYAPKGAWHGVENTGPKTLIWCATYSPPGFEQYFREVGTRVGSDTPPPSPEQVSAAARKYGMVFKNP